MAVVLVTGGAGFVGARVVHLLLESKSCSEIQAATTPDCKVVSIKGSICDVDVVGKAVEGCSAVFHCAAIIDWGQRPYSEIYKVNVVGTQNVLHKAKASGVKYFIFTSTMDVLLAAGVPTVDKDDDDLTYPTKFLYGPYAETKAIAEREVLASASDTFFTAAIRPCGVYGERDPWHFPNVLASARSGKLSVRIGSATNVFQHVYVDNVAHGHICAFNALRTNPGPVSGQGFVITDSPASNFWDFVSPVVVAAGAKMPPAWLTLPDVVFISFLLRPFVTFHPLLTPLSANGMLYSQSFTGKKARRLLGYEPIVDHDEAMRRTIEYFCPESKKKST